MKKQNSAISRLKKLEARACALMADALEEIACCFKPRMLRPVAVKTRRRADNSPHAMGHHRSRNVLGEK
jgi:hypothetical protein